MRTLLLALIPLVVLGLVVWQQPPALRRRLLLWIGGGALVLGLIYLAATGRLHWLAALAASLLPFLRRLLPLVRFVPLLRGLARGQAGGGARQGTAGRQSRVQTEWLRMVLDHDSGQMSGEVLRGRWAGRALAELPFAELLELLRELQREHRESADLLQAYLQREHAEAWQSWAAGGAAGTQEPAGDAGAAMTREEALRILGLPDETDEAQIVEAHRRLMQKLHPDRGGSDYLAAKVNAAKDHLLAESRGQRRRSA